MRQELHAGHVEDTLLGQVRVARVGQEIDVWVLGRTRVRLRVGASLPLFFSLCQVELMGEQFLSIRSQNPTRSCLRPTPK